MQTCARSLSSLALTAAVVLLWAPPARAQVLAGKVLVDALRQGGFVIVMRHASSPREAPAKEAANADNVNFERQLDEGGRAAAVAMGTTIRELKIPIGAVLTSPAYRALETVRLAQFKNPLIFAEIGDNGQSMQEVTDAQVAWLRTKVTQFPTRTNTIIVTHMPNISRAFPEVAPAVSDGEALVYGSDGNGGATLVGRVRIEEWPGMR